MNDNSAGVGKGGSKDFQWPVYHYESGVQDQPSRLMTFSSLPLLAARASLQLRGVERVGKRRQECIVITCCITQCMYVLLLVNTTRALKQVIIFAEISWAPRDRGRVPNSPQPLMVTSDPIRILYGIFGQSPETHSAARDQHTKLSVARLSTGDEENRRPTSFPAHRYLR